jgi:hypothetical protein
MRRLILAAVVTAVAATLAFPLAASAEPVQYVEGPPAADVYGIFFCNAVGSLTVPAGRPFTFRLTGWLSGTEGLVRSFISKDGSSATIERPLGSTPTNLPFRWQAPTLLQDGFWAVYRWPPAFTLARGEQMRLVFTHRLLFPARDLSPPSSTLDPGAFGLEPWDGTGLKYDGGVVQPFTQVLACTINGA